MSTSTAAGKENSGGVEESDMFGQLCGNVTTAMLTLDNVIQEFLNFKDEILKHPLSPNLLVSLAVMSSRLFRSYSDLCTPVGELNRLSLLHSSSWEKKAESLKKIRSDYEGMQRRLSIVLKKLEMMSAEVSRNRRVKMLGHWERLFCHVMQTKSRGRRWKFRIEPLRRKLEAGYNPYLSDSDSNSDMDENDDELLFGSDEELDESNALERDMRSGHRTKDFRHEVESPETMPSTPPPPIVTADVTTSTADPSYDNYLLVQLSRPKGILAKKDICCTITLGDTFCTSAIFPGKPAPEAPLMSQIFHFPLSEDDVSSLPPSFNPSPSSSSQLLVGVYHRNISEDLAANLSLPLTDIKLTDGCTTIVPPESREEEFQLEWEKISAGVSGLPVEYPLKQHQERNFDDSDDPLLPIICHRVKVQRHQNMQSSTMTLPWNELMLELGYRELAETQSRAASALPYNPTPSPTPEEAGPTEAELREEMEEESREKLVALTFQHMEEMKQLQQQYEVKLNSLSKTLAKVKADKARQIEDLEQSLVEMEKNRATGQRGRSMADIQRALEQRRKRSRVTQGLPEWGKDLPDDFFDRLELFREESIKKQEELIGRVRREVSEACEKQLATQHKLAPGTNRGIDTITEDITLPALFMPSSITKHLVYTPRAHQYFHPPGSSDNRLTQPPAVFKLPALQAGPGLQTLNLFELSQHFSQTGPQWLKETDHHQSPHPTPAPPPSTREYHHTHPETMPRLQEESLVLSEENGSVLDYEETKEGSGIRMAVGGPHRTK